jgi:LPXTG-site transpeptidase (sortase) family protein
MEISKQDRNTGITIALILAVCTLSLVAIVSVILQIIGPGLQSFAAFFGEQVQASNVQYNFEVPERRNVVVQAPEAPVETEVATEAIALGDWEISSDLGSQVAHVDYSVPTPTSVNYNFPVPALDEQIIADTEVSGFEDAILNDAVLAGYGEGTRAQTNIKLKIPKLDVNAYIYQGLGGGDELRKGFWAYPTSKPFGQGDLILLCHRRYFGTNDPRSCWYLDKLEKGDKMKVTRGDANLNYEVVGVNVFEPTDPRIYTISNDDYLKIVTCTPLGISTHRLVILAKRI